MLGLLIMVIGVRTCACLRHARVDSVLFCSVVFVRRRCARRVCVRRREGRHPHVPVPATRRRQAQPMLVRVCLLRTPGLGAGQGPGLRG